MVFASDEVGVVFFECFTCKADVDVRSAFHCFLIEWFDTGF